MDVDLDGLKLTRYFTVRRVPSSRTLEALFPQISDQTFKNVTEMARLIHFLCSLFLFHPGLTARTYTGCHDHDGVQ